MFCKRFRLKPNVTMDLIKACGFKPGGDGWIHKDAVVFKSWKLNEDISLNIAFPDNLGEWNDFDFVLVLDEEFGQPYTPFYEAKKHFEFLDRVIKRYNAIMTSMTLFEECEDEGNV